LPEQVQSAAVAVVGDDIYVVGGEATPTGLSDRTYTASVSTTGTLSSWALNPLRLPAPLTEATLVPVGAKLVLTGGRTALSYSSDVLATNALSTLSDVQLLDRFRPVLRYDQYETYRADSPAEMTDNYVSGSYTNRLQTSTGKVLAESDPSLRTADLSLAYLRPAGVKYSGGGTASSADKIDAANSYDSDFARLHQLPGYADKTVAHVLNLSDGTRVAQYWFFYYDNPKTYFTIGAHEGDWEMMQVHVGADQQPIEATYSQHNGGERCDWIHVQRDVDGHPIVYVAEGSHASYFSSGYHFNSGADDNASGDVEARPSVIDTTTPPDWINWPGHWGGSDASPAGPLAQGGGLKWNSPISWSGSVDGCTEGQTYSRAQGRATHSARVHASALLAAPKLAARRLADGRIRIRYLVPPAARGVTVGLFGGSVPVSRTIRIHHRRGALRLRPLAPGRVLVRAVALDRRGRRGREARVVVP
jgi:hypothetical protein